MYVNQRIITASIWYRPPLTSDPRKENMSQTPVSKNVLQKEQQIATKILGSQDQ